MRHSARHIELRERSECGFTLIEMMISLAIGLLLIAGLSSLFVADSNTARVLSSRGERMGDLFLASHLMQEALRESRSAPDPNLSILTDLTARGVALPANYPADPAFTALPYWDASSKTLTYQTLEGHVGIFHYQHAKKDRIYWLRPSANIRKFEELMRDLDKSIGMRVYDPASGNPVTTALGGGLRVDLAAAYSNESKQGKTLTLSFMAWPRN